MSPFISDGIISAEGCLENANVTTDVKHSIVLPSTGRFTELIVREAHVRTGQSGRQLVLADLRRRFWIVRESLAVRRVLSQCPVCRRHRPPETQKMSDLPADRVASKPVFTSSGVDYFCHFYVTKNRSQSKLYGVIVTCFSVRAEHICRGRVKSVRGFLSLCFETVQSKTSSRQGDPD